jgi:hypothetical protein
MHDLIQRLLVSFLDACPELVLGNYTIVSVSKRQCRPNEREIFSPAGNELDQAHRVAEDVYLLRSILV